MVTDFFISRVRAMREAHFEAPKGKMPELPITPWQDEFLISLSRNTSGIISHDWQGNELGDYFDCRWHLMIFYSMVKAVCWPDPHLPPTSRPLVLEIGVRHGVSTLALLSACRETEGQLISLDVDVEPLCATRARVEAFQLSKWWTPVLIGSDEFAPMAVGNSFDVIWVDGDHSYEQVKKDVQNYAYMVRPNGFLLMHDYWKCADPAHETWYPEWKETGVKPVVNELLRDDFEVVVLPWSFGLVIARRKQIGE